MKVFAILMLVFCGANADRVIGGTDASSGQFPSIVFQEKGGSFFCGGTLISANVVLTAAHCEQNLNGAAFTVTGGTNTRNAGGTTITVSGKLVHRQYNSRTLQNDIQLLYLQAPFNLEGEDIAAASLVSTRPDDGDQMTVAGWGDTNSGTVQYLPNNLQFTSNVAVISTSACNAADAYDNEILPGMICIGEMNGGYDTCQGDSGGPAYTGDGSEDIIAGITSWGYGCAQANNPGVYTDVAYYNTWITENM